MFLFDPLYALVVVLSLGLSLGAQAWVVAAIRSQAIALRVYGSRRRHE